DYKEQDNQLIDISPDGALVLIETRQPCPNQTHVYRDYCSVLLVYETGSTRMVGKLEMDRIQNGLAGFTKDKQVILYDYKAESISQWDPVSSKVLNRQIERQDDTKNMKVLCSAGDGKFLALTTPKVQPAQHVRSLQEVITEQSNRPH